MKTSFQQAPNMCLNDTARIFKATALELSHLNTY